MKQFALAFALCSFGAILAGCGGGGGGGGPAPGGGGGNPSGAVQPPSGLSYSQANSVLQVGLGFFGTGNMPSYSGGPATSFTIAPALPPGLHLIGSSGDTQGAPTNTIGAIWGTPTAVSKQTTYTVTASNAAGSTSAQLIIAVADTKGTWRQDVASSYATAPGGLSGTFATGQNADIMLGGIDFNNTGGSGLYNHPGSLACDSSHLVVPDRNNNRVLIWNSLPTSNVPPDLVLGQPDFIQNNPGTGPNQMNWPVGASVGGGRLAVADTDNNRILLWDAFPTASQQAASRSIAMNWPWSVWTDGSKAAGTETLGNTVQLWNSWPQQTNQAPSVLIHGPAVGMGTPRMITSNGNYLVVGDYNATAPPSPIENFFWTSWPSAPDQAANFVQADPTGQGYVMQGTITPDNHLAMIGLPLSIWNAPPTTASQAPNLIVGTFVGSGLPGFPWETGDGSGACFAGGILYVNMANGNRVVGFHGLPTSATQLPDFALGAPDIYTNTFNTRGFIANPIPATDGTSLFVSGGSNASELLVWKTRPNQSGAQPDYIFHFKPAQHDLTLMQGKLFLAGQTEIIGWTGGSPAAGAFPDFYLSGGITTSGGNLQFQQLRGVSWDGTYFALSDGMANKVYVWNGLPTPARLPDRTIDTGTSSPQRLSSNGTMLAVVLTFDHKIALYDLTNTAAAPQYVVTNGTTINLNLPQGALLAGNQLFVGDTGNNRVQIWNNFSSAVASNPADIILGQPNATSITPMIGQNRLFSPANLSFDGSYLWVGEFKFSQRLLRFSVH